MFIESTTYDHLFVATFLNMLFVFIKAYTGKEKNELCYQYNTLYIAQRKIAFNCLIKRKAFESLSSIKKV